MNPYDLRPVHALACGPARQPSTPDPAEASAHRKAPPATLRGVLVVKILFWASLALLAWTHVLYPLFAAVWARLRPRPVHEGDALPRVALVIAAHNEEDVIAAKLENALALDYPRELLQIVVASDASSDAHRRHRRVVRGPRRRPLPLPARRQGQRPERHRAHARRRRPGVLRRELPVGAGRAAPARAAVLRPEGGLRLRPPARCAAPRARTRRACTGATSSGCGRQESRTGSVTGGNGSIYAVPPRALRGGRPALRPRPLVPVPDGQARLPRRSTGPGRGPREDDHRQRGRVPPQGAHVRPLLAARLPGPDVRPAGARRRPTGCR